MRDEAYDNRPWPMETIAVVEDPPKLRKHRTRRHKRSTKGSEHPNAAYRKIGWDMFLEAQVIAMNDSALTSLKKHHPEMWAWLQHQEAIKAELTRRGIPIP